MKIGYVTSGYMPSRGGVETHVAGIAVRLARQGHEVEVFTQDRDRSLPAHQTIDGVVVHRFAPILPEPAYPFAPGLWGALARRRFDVLHVHNYHAFPALGAALVGHEPLVFTPHFHGTGHRPLGRLLHIPYRVAGGLIFRRSQWVICVSGIEADRVRRHFPFTAEHLTVIPNGVDLSALRSARPFQVTGTVLLSVGRLLAYKNVGATIAALSSLDRSISLYVVGEGPERPALQAQTERLGLENRVHFLSWVGEDELRRWYRTAAIYVTMSAEEAFGITPLEALGAGAMVVASDIPAHREVAARTGSARIRLLPPDGDPARLAAAIDALLAHPPRDGEPPIIPTWDEVADRTLTVYRALLDARSG